jgi:hypothetical protein
MTPRSIPSLRIGSGTDALLTRRRFETDHTYFGYSVVESLSAWHRNGSSSSLVAVARVRDGFLMGILRGSESRATFELFRARDAQEARRLVSGQLRSAQVVGVAASASELSIAMDAAKGKEILATRDADALSEFRKSSLGREDLIEGDFRQAVLEEAFDFGSMCSGRAEELLLSDLMSLALCGPDASAHH